RGEIGRTHQPRLVVNEVENLPLVPGMVAHRDAVHTRLEQFLGDRGGDAPAARGIFPVGDDEMRAVCLPEPGHHPLYRFPSRTADNVSDKDHVHCYFLPAGKESGRLLCSHFQLLPYGGSYLAYSTARVSRMTVTLIWPG